MKIKFLVALLMIGMLSIFVGCNPETEPSITEPSIVGTWICNEDISGPNKLVFSDSSSVTAYVYGEVWLTGSYTAVGNSATIRLSGYWDVEYIEYVFSANFGENSLTLTGYVDGTSINITYMKA